MKHMATTDPQQREVGSFTSGFTLGFLTGALGYYLFATDRGIQLRKRLMTEWEVTKESMVKEGLVTNPNMTFREFLNDILQKFSKLTPSSQTQSMGLLAQSKGGRPRVKRDHSKKFKGV
jgi:hypothetical protein